MAKINKPLLSLSAIGALGKHLVFRRRGKGIVAQQTARPVDRRSFAQLQWRTLYQKAVALWHFLSPPEKEAWERQATPRHMTGFAYFISQALKPNPGIYLPLAGGTMQGDVDFDGHKILNLPAPGADQEPTRKVDLATHSSLEAAIHGLKGEVGFSAHATSDQAIPPHTWTRLVYHAELWDVGGYFDLTNNHHKPLIAGKYIYTSGVRLVDIGDGIKTTLYLRKNGASAVELDRVIPGADGALLLSGSAIIKVNGTTDYISCYVYHYDSVSRNTLGTVQSTWFQGFLIPQS